MANLPGKKKMKKVVAPTANATVKLAPGKAVVWHPDKLLSVELRCIEWRAVLSVLGARQQSSDRALGATVDMGAVIEQMHEATLLRWREAR